MRIATIGGGPAGLYFAILMKKADPASGIVVLERNAPDDTFGWGVVFSDQTLGNFAAADEPTYQEITGRFARWDDIDVHFKGGVVTSGGHGFAGIARQTLLDILRHRAQELGVDVRFRTEVAHDGDLGRLGLADADLVVAADGVNSGIRRRHAEVFRPDLDVRSARFIWLGTTRLFEAFTFIIIENEHGVFQAHAYRFDDRHSAFIVECDERSWRAAGLDRLDVDASVAACERMFAPWLDGNPLLARVPPHQRAEPWLRFTRVRNERWHHGNVVLVGDAAHTAHFSIGSGTKLAMEDSIALARLVSSDIPLPDALRAYQEERLTESLRLQNAARNSMQWFENVRRYVHLPREQFAYSLLTRSQRVSHENLRLRDREYLEGVEEWFGEMADGRTGGTAGLAARRTAVVPGDLRPAVPPAPPVRPSARPPMFTPFRLRSLLLPNRVVVSPMDMYCAEDGVPNDFHLVHLGARAIGGAGLVMTEMVCVSPEGRITPGCTGMYAPEHVEGWARITAMVHRWSAARIALQLGHSGRKGSTKLMWEGNDEPLDSGNWPVMAPSPIAFRPGMHVPREMTRADMERVRDEFVAATRMGEAAGFDMLELHCAHGYLLSGFITPLSNRRTDDYGGTLENRLRFPLEVFAAMRGAWPTERPMSVRISAHDWVDDGITDADAVEIARAFQAAGADIIHVSAGQTSDAARPVYGRMFQTPFSDRIRNEAGVPTIAVGNITEADQINSIIAAGRADLCALARPHLSDPQWTLRAAAELGYAGQPWPPQYLSGRDQLVRNLARARNP
jgi:anthraniloyl-CoA monooxygenase